MANKRFNKQVPGYGYQRGGRVNTSRENRLEELGRVKDAEKGRPQRKKEAKRSTNLSDEKKRIVRELRRI